jgi:sugar phosphate isomerase/epimerase
MKTTQLAAQLYTCRDILKTPAEIAATLRRVRAVGYQAVQVSGMGPIAEDELLQILDGEGLVCCATHESGEKILNDPRSVVERLQKLRCQYTAYPFPAGVDFSDPGSIQRLISGLQASAAVLASHGMGLCYHNHHPEFRKLEGRTILERIFDGAPHLQAEPDTYWVQYGGGDPVDWCERLKGRLPLIHLKDFVVNHENIPCFCEVGAGNLNFPRIIEAAEKSGCQWFIVEQDTTPGDPVDSLAQSFRYLAETVCES